MPYVLLALFLIVVAALLFWLLRDPNAQPRAASSPTQAPGVDQPGYALQDGNAQVYNQQQYDQSGYQQGGQQWDQAYPQQTQAEYQQPPYQQPDYQQPGYQQPQYQQPDYQQPRYTEQPTTQQWPQGQSQPQEFSGQYQQGAPHGQGQAWERESSRERSGGLQGYDPQRQQPQFEGAEHEGQAPSAPQTAAGRGAGSWAQSGADGPYDQMNDAPDQSQTAAAGQAQLAEPPQQEQDQHDSGWMGGGSPQEYPTSGQSDQQIYPPGAAPSGARQGGPAGEGSAHPRGDGGAPEGFTIKANTETGTFHTPSSTSYHTTRAQVWFADEESARAAGFHAEDESGV